MGLFRRKKKKTQENQYSHLRNMAFNIKASDLDLSFDDDSQGLYGVIMDWDMGNGIVTMVSYKTGDTSLYMSSGAGFIGAGRHQDVNQLVREFVKESEGLIASANSNDSEELPENGDIYFHFMTNNGKLTIKDNISAMENQTSPQLGYFEAANQVITAIRVASERK
jgi:hypothetical protein